MKAELLATGLHLTWRKDLPLVCHAEQHTFAANAPVPRERPHALWRRRFNRSQGGLLLPSVPFVFTGRHATRHAHHTAHPVIASYEPGERWAWCYVDQTEVDVPALAVPYLR